MLGVPLPRKVGVVVLGVANRRAAHRHGYHPARVREATGHTLDDELMQPFSELGAARGAEGPRS